MRGWRTVGAMKESLVHTHLCVGRIYCFLLMMFSANVDTAIYVCLGGLPCGNELAWAVAVLLSICLCCSPAPLATAFHSRENCV